MKSLNRIFLRYYNLLISFLLMILGFGAAFSLNGCEDTAHFYGTPSADFKVKGVIRSEETLNPVEHIRVLMGYDTLYHYNYFDTTYSDAQGNYHLKIRSSPSDKDFVLKFEDMDGESNGNFQPIDTIVEFKDPHFTGGDGPWYSGSVEEVVNVNL